ncbi:hypothetical protein llap_19804 [Limosa lapponica baueri]|uniref:Uncharacterized protein n=1 Tax=Limosa lapponica baueri TaxID=1758121 RepID=A0A2I0T7Y2_LIMLA|nr:hypothetical protein llap_19804 [Limosa lapponica baueri]
MCFPPVLMSTQHCYPGYSKEHLAGGGKNKVCPLLTLQGGRELCLGRRRKKKKKKKKKKRKKEEEEKKKKKRKKEEEKKKKELAAGGSDQWVIKEWVSGGWGQFLFSGAQGQDKGQRAQM